ncbi:MAG: class I SAM-dependent methyltransferase [Candidatus Acidiferrales bacterium]
MEYQVGTRIGGRDPLLPPKWLQSVGSPDLKNFSEVGEEFLQYFVNFGRLLSDQRVLDVGCGTGRMALPLTKYLKSGSYEGMDIDRASIEWCQKTYTTRYPNFRFHFSDIYNKMYNASGKYRASDYEFPFESSSFDFVFLTSVFTHMLPKDLEYYFSEVVRVLKRDGRCLITYFLLNPESLQLIAEKASHFNFQYDLPGCRVENNDVPEGAVGYAEGVVRDLYGKHGLNLLEPIRFGRWCGRKNGLSWQDMIVAVKSH